MAINQIQFQIGLSLIEFLKLFDKEKACRDYLRQQKWPEGFRCRRCSYERSSIQIKGIRETHECLNCFYKESLLAHTLFEHSHLPLKTWFLAIQLLTQAKTCMSAMELHRHLQVNIKTANLIKHKVMQTLTDAEKGRVLQDRIECDEAYLGGRGTSEKIMQNSGNKTPFLAAIQTDKAHHPQFAVFSTVKNFSRDEINSWAKLHIAAHSLVLSDGHDCFKGLGQIYRHHIYTAAAQGRSVFNYQFKWVNTVLNNIKSGFSGALHAFNFKKYSSRYLGNMQFRFNHRFDLKQCFYQVLNQAIQTAVKPARFLYSQESG